MTMDDREQWLAWRRAGIGASDVPAILGISPWASPYSTWASKMGLVPDDDPTERMELGLALEPFINEMFHLRTGLYVVGAQTRCEHPDKPWARATLDGYVSETPWKYGDDAIDPVLLLGNLEAKTTADSPRQWEEAIPDHYAAQVAWQMYVTGATHTWVAALHASHGLAYRVYEVTRDEDDIKFIVDRVTKFWLDHICTGIPPETDGTAATTEALRHLPVDPDAIADLTDHEPTLAALADAKAKVKEYEALVSTLENRVKAAMGECTEGFIDGRTVATWRTQTRTGIDLKGLKADMPEVAYLYATESTSRVFRLSTKKENQ